MEAARPLAMSVADYLAFEESSNVRHEFVGGQMHAMAGESLAHNTIVLNISALLRAKLRGTPCRVFIENVKLLLEAAREDIFYYPDVVVTCHPTAADAKFVRLPTLLCEVLSPSTENTDRREKKMLYQQIPTLEEYVIVAQERRELTIFRRVNSWAAEVVSASEAIVEFRSIKQALALREIYEDVL